MRSPTLLFDGAAALKGEDAVVGERAPVPQWPLTTAQSSIWIDQALHPGRPIYNTGQIVTIGVPLDRALFEEALADAVAAHDALRLKFHNGAAIKQSVVSSTRFDVPFRDFRSGADPAAEAQAWLLDEFWRPLRPTDSPLFRFRLAQVAADRFLWLQKYHHLIIDATGRQIVARDVADRYGELLSGSGRPSVRPPSYVGAVESDDAYLGSARYLEDRAYWATRFSDPVQSLIDRTAATAQKTTTGRATRVKLRWDTAAAAGLKAEAKRHDASLFKLLLLFVWRALHAHYGKTDFVIGVPLANRPTPADKETVGLFSKLIPFRIELDPDAPLPDAMRRLSQQFDQDMDHQRFPLDHVSRGCAWRRKADVGIIDVVLNFVRYDYSFFLRRRPDRLREHYRPDSISVPWGFMLLDYAGSEFRAAGARLRCGAWSTCSAVEQVTRHLQASCSAWTWRGLGSPCGTWPRVTRASRLSCLRSGEGTRPS